MVTSTYTRIVHKRKDKNVINKINLLNNIIIITIIVLFLRLIPLYTFLFP